MLSASSLETSGKCSCCYSFASCIWNKLRGARRIPEGFRRNSTSHSKCYLYSKFFSYSPYNFANPAPFPKISYEQNRPVSFKALLHYAIFSATCLVIVENLALQVAEVWCWGPVTLCNFVCAYALVKTAVKLRDKLLEGWYTMQWCCQLLQSIAKSRAVNVEHVTLCNSPATCLAMPLRDRLLRKLHIVTGSLPIAADYNDCIQLMLNDLMLNICKWAIHNSVHCIVRCKYHDHRYLYKFNIKLRFTL